MPLITFSSRHRKNGIPSDYTEEYNGTCDLAGMLPSGSAKGLRLMMFSMPDTIVNVSARNNQLDFYEGVFGVLSTSVPVGYHTVDTISAEIAAAMTAKSASDGCGNVYTVSVDSLSQVLTIEASGGALKPFGLRCKTGPNAAISLWNLIGACDVSGGRSVGADLDSAVPGGSGGIFEAITMPATVNMIVASIIYIRVFINGFAAQSAKEFSSGQWCTFSIPHDTRYGSQITYDASKSIEPQIMELDAQRQQRINNVRFQLVDDGGIPLDIQNSDWQIHLAVI